MAGAPATMVRKSPEIAMNPRALVKTPYSTRDPDARPAAATYHLPQVDVSTQVDIPPGVYHLDWDRRATPLYSREDIKEQYCITSRQLDAVERSGSGFFGCLTSRGPSPCSTTKASILSACVRSAPSEENLFDAPYPRKHFSVKYQQPYSTYPRHLSRYDYEYYEDWDESPYIRRRPKSCTVPDPRRYTGLHDDDEHFSGVYPISPQPPQFVKTKHVSFARSQTLTSFDMPRTKSPPRPHTQERLIDSQPASSGSLPATLPAHRITTAEPRIVVLEKSKRGAMKTQATQTDTPSFFRGRIPISLSPRTIHRVKMVSQGAQTNGILNGRKLTKSYSEAGQLGTPLGANGAIVKEEVEHEPLQRTQSEEPPRSPFMVTTPPHSPELKNKTDILNGDSVHYKNKEKKKEIEAEDQEIFIDFKPAPVSPDARAMLNEMPKTYRKMMSMQKTFSDGEIRVERRELISETGEPSYPHSCRRNHQDMWSKTLYTPVQFSSTPDDLSLLRITSPHEEHRDEEFHENLIRRGVLFRKRSVSLEDGVQCLSVNEYIFPRSLPTSPTSPTSVSAPTKIIHSSKGELFNRYLPHTRRATGISSSPFASTDSLTNDITRDHSDGNWNESQATVLQADSILSLTPSSKRRHMLILQHQQRSSMDTEALDVEDDLDINSCSPRVHLEPPTPISTAPPSMEPAISTIERPRSGLLRRSPLPSHSQTHSQSSSEFGLSLARTDSGGKTDISETSTTDDYITANTSTGTGNTTGTSATTSSWSRPPYPALGGVPSQSTTGTVADGSSFESASSVYSLARSEAVIDENVSPTPHIIARNKKQLALGEHPSSPVKSTTSSSSGSYDLEDAHTVQEPIQASITGQEHDVDIKHEIYKPSPGFPGSPPERPPWTEDERHHRKSSFSLDFVAGVDPEFERINDVILDNMEVSPTLSHRHKSRTKPATVRSPHRNNKRRDSSSQQLVRSPQEEWREIPDDSAHVQTSDDSSCSHHYYHHYHHHHGHKDSGDNGRHRRTRESPRRKSGSYTSTRRRSNEDKNAALTGSLPRRRSRQVDDTLSSSRLSPGRYQRSPGHNGHTAVVVKSPSPEARLKAVSVESLRSASPGSDSVFYNEVTDQYVSMLDTQHCHHCGREVPEDIVQPPAGFADSPEGHRSTKQTSHRLYKKFEKRFRSEDRNERRHHRGSIGRSDGRAKSEERGTRPNRYEEGVRRRLQARSTDASMEILTVREDEDIYAEPYTSGEWIYIGDLEESHVWRRPDSRDSEEDMDVPVKDRRGSQDSTESEKCFRKKYQAATHRMVHRKSSGEMYKRIQRKSFESDKRVVVRREAGGEFGFRIHGSKPVVVSAIEPDTPAESSGLEVGDIIMSVNGRSVMESTHSEVVRLAHSGCDVLELEVARTCNVLAPQISKSTSKESKTAAPIYSGYLWRKAATMSDKWVRRWFALRRDNCLYYYKTDGDSQPVGAVMLLKYDVQPTKESRPHSFAIRKPGAPTLHLAADSDEAAVRWSTIIREAVERNNQADTWLNASLRMQQMPPSQIQRPDCFGYLSKQQERARKSSSPTGWSRRYCVLKDAALYFYDDVDAERAFGVACLHGFRVHGSAPTSGGRKHAFELQPPDPTQRSYTFSADSEMDKKRWLAALEYSIDRWIKIG